MLINKKTDYCSYCGTYCEHNYGEENYNAKQLDLDNYFKYKDIYVYKCPKCEMVSTDLATEDKKLFDAIINTDRYSNVVTYEYLEGLDLELFENHTFSEYLTIPLPDRLEIIYSEIQQQKKLVALH